MLSIIQLFFYTLNIGIGIHKLGAVGKYFLICTFPSKTVHFTEEVSIGFRVSLRILGDPNVHEEINVFKNNKVMHSIMYL